MSEYTNTTPTLTEELRRLWMKGRRIFIFGDGGTHLVAWDVAGRGRTTHAETERQLARHGKIIIIKNSDLLRRVTRPAVLVETFREGKRYGIVRITHLG